MRYILDYQAPNKWRVRDTHAGGGSDNHALVTIQGPAATHELATAILNFMNERNKETQK